MNQEPFFVIGAPRSGTTMLQLALSRHSRIVIPPETAFFTLLKRSWRGQSRHWTWVEKDLQVRVDPPGHRIRPGPVARGHFCRVADAYLERLGRETVTHFGEKTPEHQRRIPGILRTFPEAKFVLIYRDGRDVAASLTKLSWMPSDLYVAFFVWLHYYRIQRRLLQREPQRVICVRYEDLVRNPSAELRLILGFLGLDYEPQVAEGSGNHDGVTQCELTHKARALQAISPDRIGIWRHELPEKKIARLERWGGWALHELGYECVTDGRSVLPPWHFPVLYSRIATDLAVRTLQRKVDELCGTCFYRPNRIARDLPDPEPFIKVSCNTERTDSESSAGMYQA